ncbi:MAG TPA: caspase family protein, partial [Flavobacteriales bacterium]|nr:caspase family protein [Flavobacteriales bacterium]
MKKLLFLLCALPCMLQAQKFDAKNTYVLIVGVLKWKDSQCLHPFSDVNRKDWELKDQLVKMGVPVGNITSLTDEKADLASIQKGFETLSAKCTGNSTFIFYYAGHGIKKEHEYYFANYDIECERCKKTGFGLSYLSTDLLSMNKAGTIMLWADCCYSGALLAQGEKIKEAGRNCIVFSSATASNTSTGNWTFTQTLLDCFRNEKINDDGKDGKITTKDIRLALENAMKYREHQMGGYYSSFTSEYEFVSGATKTVITMPSKGSYASGSYAYGKYEGNWKPVRIIAPVGNKYLARFYFYSDYKDVELGVDELKPIYFTKHNVNDKVDVTWEGQKYASTILKAVNDFYYIKYDGYDDSYNEWVMYDRIYTGKETSAKIEENGKWYPGQIMEEKNGKYFIRYSG